MRWSLRWRLSPSHNLRLEAARKRRGNSTITAASYAAMTQRRFILWIAASLSLVAAVQAERINQEGRILGPAPVVTTPTLFNTPAADAIVSAMQIMPRDSSWNEDISRRPVLPNSDAIIAQITSDLSANRRKIGRAHV